jgi:glycosyltransferase involved in cell wall biosynthesis
MSNYLNQACLEPEPDFRVHLISLHADPATAPGAAGGGGTHSYLRELLTSLPRRRRAISVITRRTSSNLAAHQVLSRSADIFRVRIGEIAPIDKERLEALHPLSLQAVREALATSAAPVRVLHSVYWNSGRVALDLSRERGIPFVHTVISNGKRRVRAGAAAPDLRREDVEHQIFEAAFRIFCVCSAERDDLVELYGVDASKIVVIGRPISIDVLVPPHDEWGDPRLLPPWNDLDGSAGDDSGIRTIR